MTPFVQIAPMEGVVDFILRDLLSALGGLDRTVTEFVRVTDRLLPDHVFYRYCPELKTGGRTNSGTPVYIQLLGGDPSVLAENAALAATLGAPGIDLNFGCPAKTVNRHDGGATLLKNPERLFHIITAVKKALAGRIPVTAKVRLGFEDKSLHREIAQAVSDAGAAQLAIHARTKLEGYKPPAHWEFIASMKSVCRIPLVANGDIWSVKDYFRCREITGVDDVALGRGLVARPDLARQIKAATQGHVVDPLSWNDLLSHFLPRFIKQSLIHRGEAFAVPRLKQILKCLARNYPESSMTFETIKTMKHLMDIQSFLFSNKNDDVLNKEVSWPESKFTPGPTVRTACEQRIF
jgi:tRNA-dihydrouridine synthase C